MSRVGLAVVVPLMVAGCVVSRGPGGHMAVPEGFRPVSEAPLHFQAFGMPFPLPLVEAMMDGHPRAFILDTGVLESALSSDFARASSLPLAGTAAPEPSGLGQGSIPSLILAGVQRSEVPVAVVEMDAAFKKFRIAGFLNPLQSHAGHPLVIDLGGARLIDFGVRPASWNELLQASFPGRVVQRLPVRLCGAGRPIVWAALNEGPLVEVAVDSGSPTTSFSRGYAKSYAATPGQPSLPPGGRRSARPSPGMVQDKGGAKPGSASDRDGEADSGSAAPSSALKLLRRLHRSESEPEASGAKAKAKPSKKAAPAAGVAKEGERERRAKEEKPAPQPERGEAGTRPAEGGPVKLRSVEAKPAEPVSAPPTVPPPAAPTAQPVSPPIPPAPAVHVRGGAAAASAARAPPIESPDRYREQVVRIASQRFHGLDVSGSASLPDRCGAQGVLGMDVLRGLAFVVDGPAMWVVWP